MGQNSDKELQKHALSGMLAKKGETRAKEQTYRAL